MAYRKATLRRMSPVVRRYARLLNDLDSILRRGKNLVEEISRLELDSRALEKSRDLNAETIRKFPHLFRDEEGEKE